MKNKHVKQMICGVQSELNDCKAQWVYFKSNKSKHFGEVVFDYDENDDGSDSLYYGTPISLTINQLKGSK